MSNVIDEFLVSLGFKIDADGLKKFKESVGGITKDVQLLGAAMAATAATVYATTQTIAAGFDKINYTARLAGSSIDNLKGLQFGFSQVGLSADTATAAAQNLASFMRKTPSGGVKSLFASLGIDNSGKDPTQLIVDLAKLFSMQRDAGQYARAVGEGQLFGMDEKTVFLLAEAYKNGSLVKSMDEMRNKIAQSGLDMKDLAKESTEFMNSLRGIGESIGLVLDVMVLPVLKELNPILKELNREIIPMYNTMKSWSDPKTNDENIPFGLRQLHQAAVWTGTKINQGYGASLNTVLQRNLGLSPSQDERAQEMYSALIQGGMTHAQAVGVVANAKAESKFNENAVGDNGQAHGLFQWHSDRRKSIYQGTGIDVSNASFQSQIKAMMWELRNNESGAGDKLRMAQTPEQAAAIFSKFYERPADEAGAMKDRASIANAFDKKLQPTESLMKGGQNVNITNTINVSGAGDPKAVAGSVMEKMQNSNAALTRYGYRQQQ